MNSPEKSFRLPKGFSAAGMACGLKKSGKKDLALIYSTTPCAAAGVYTTNKVKAAPVRLTKSHLANGQAQAVIVNSGNANAACRKEDENAALMAKAAAEKFGISPDDVAVASTGVIGQEMNMDPILNALPDMILSADGLEDAAAAIMTTDTVSKFAEITFTIDGVDCFMSGFCKGSGMIHPNMGTMLAFVMTDAAIDPALLQKDLLVCTRKTFNRVSVDGDTSTNDMCLVLANGQAGNPVVSEEDGTGNKEFTDALMEVMKSLAIAIASDGEGAGRLITATVKGAASEKQAEILARSIVSSSLLKAAIFGSDANWGRVICAMGYADTDFDPKTVDISFASGKGEILVCQQGFDTGFDEDKAKEILLEPEIEILCDLHEGNAEATCWGCDLTYEYVRINGDYRS